LYNRIVIPPGVLNELEQGRRIGVHLPELAALRWMSVQAPERVEGAFQAGALGHGEREVLALGLQMPSSVLILDDGSARACASELNLTYTGTLGVLLRAKKERRLSQIGPLIDQLGVLGFRLSPRTRTAVLALAGE
jgi:predicted nucleic acid-binding protein